MAETPIGEDMLYGIDEIGRELKIIRDGMSAEQLRLARKRTRNLIGKGGLPVWNEPGIGLVALRSRLRDHFNQQAEKAIRGAA